MKKYGVLLLLLFTTGIGWGQIQRICQYGALPTDNITMLEINPSLTAIDDSGGVSLSQLMIKMYYTLDKNYNWGIEVPLGRYESPTKSINGLGDTLANISWLNAPDGKRGFGYGAKMEMFLPTATDELLGSGQLQASPSIFLWWGSGPGFYVAAGYKHYVSMIGDHAREDINLGRFRLNISYLSPNQWWVQTNWYYYQDFHQPGKAEFVPELEIGALINEGTAFYINGSTHASGNLQGKDWSLGVGFKILYL